MTGHRVRSLAAVAAVALVVPLAVDPLQGAAAADVPLVAAHVQVDNYRNVRFTGYWSLPAGAEAVLCFSPDRTPTSPETAATCSAPDPYRATLIGVGSGSPVSAEPVEHFAVFARAGSTGTWGPPAVAAGGSWPPFPPAALSTTGLSAEALRLHWEEASSGFGSDYSGVGGTTAWVVTWVRGSSAPEDAPPDSVRQVVVPAGQLSARVDGLAANTDYTFQVRGRDDDGHLSDWSEPRLARARRPGLLLAAGQDRRRTGWMVDRVPRTRRAEVASVAVQRRVVRVLSQSGTVVREHVLQRGGWSTRTARAGAAGVAAGSDGTLAALYGTCVAMKRPSHPWRIAWCPRKLAVTSPPALDEHGRVHTFVQTREGVLYVTNVSGGWQTRLSAFRTLPAVAYDAPRRLLVALEQVPRGDVRTELSVRTSGPGETTFRKRWSSTVTLSGDPVVAAHAGRVWIAAPTPDGLHVVAARTGGGGRRAVSLRTTEPTSSAMATSDGRRAVIALTTLAGVRAVDLLYQDGTLSTARSRLCTRSPYDQALDAAVARDGAVRLLVLRRKGDVRLSAG